MMQVVSESSFFESWENHRLLFQIKLHYYVVYLFNFQSVCRTDQDCQNGSNNSTRKNAKCVDCTCMSTMSPDCDAEIDGNLFVNTLDVLS